MADLAEPIVTSRATTRDDDSTIHLERIQEANGKTSIALWGTEDVAPTVALAYTLVPEEAFIDFLREAGYNVTPPAVAP